MDSIKNNNKFKLVSMCIALYLYEVIIGIIWSYNVKKLMAHKSDIQQLIIVALLQLLMLLPIIVGTLATNLKNIKLSINNNLKPKIISRKIFLTIMFSAGVIFILFPLKASGDSEFKIIYMIISLILALPEEILFRWFFQKKFEQIISNKFIATLIPGLLFSIIHLFGPNSLNSSTNMLLMIFSLGNRTTGHFFFNFIKEKSNSIVVPTIVHAIYNYLIMYL